MLLKNKLSHQPIFAAWQQLPSPQITFSMASLGFDWIVVDLEHTSMSIQDAETIFIAAESLNCKPFVRLSSADPYLARRLLDAGALGLILPVVESKNSFDEFAQHCFFPPQGKRGLGLVRANRWGSHLEEYFNEFKPILIAQIETKLGAESIQNILSSQFIDGIMIGPYDLSASLGSPGKFDDPFFKELCKTIREEAIRQKKMLGFHQVEPCLSKLETRIQEGYDFIAYGTDMIALRYALQGINR
ncbi:MAG: 2,4-dihydroxyhept-2-ene-1,7-dioic acid aldolase [Proteobacteria bacterium]|nr:2,4-dihydroxyhept-2-ene-1,7-dioic acid aldolase [Pseudomonadota bacterium]